MILKVWSAIYRLTGYHSDYAKAREYEYISKFLSEGDYFEVSILIGTWQANNGFYRSLNSKNLKKRNK